MARDRRFQIPLRTRLGLWYTLSLGLILVLFMAFLYFQVRSSLVAQVDAALDLAAAQALITLDRETGELAGGNPEAIGRLNDDFVITLRAPGGALLDLLSSENNLPPFPMATGFHTVTAGGDPWRVYGQEVAVSGQKSGLLQVAQELDPVNSTLADLRAQLLLGLPLALLLAGSGGFFLAGRALRPVDRITQTAQAISAGDLGRRIRYQGPADEVGRLAQTFDAMLERLQAAFDRERRFTGDAAHELRTPLTALKGRIGLTLSRPRPPAAYRESLREMEEQVDRLIRLSNDLLLIARLDQGQFRFQASVVEAAEVIGVVVDQIRPLADAKSIALGTEVPAGLAIRGDLELLIRLFLNVLDNALKYAPEKGWVNIQAQRQGPAIVVNIGDNGPGIAPENLPHLFERFYRADQARSRPNDGQGGAGLGLAIAHEITRLHQGQLSVQSEVGQGTAVTVQLPAVGEG